MAKMGCCTSNNSYKRNLLYLLFVPITFIYTIFFLSLYFKGFLNYGLNMWTWTTLMLIAIHFFITSITERYLMYLYLLFSTKQRFQCINHLMRYDAYYILFVNQQTFTKITFLKSELYIPGTSSLPHQTELQTKS